jgi:hypothetical protein
VEGLSSPSFQASFVEMEHASHGWFRRDSPMILQESPQRHRRSCYLPLPRCQSWVGAGPTLTKRRPGKFGDFSLGPWTSLVFSLLRNLIHPHLASSTYLFSCKYYFIVIFAVAYLSQNPIVVPSLLPPYFTGSSSTSCVQPYRAFPIIRESEISQGSASA